MKRALIVVIAIAAWQVEMAVEAGIAASRRPAKAQVKSQVTTPQPPVCTGPSCRQPQPMPQPQVIRTYRR